MSRASLWPLIPSNRLRRMSITDVYGFQCKAYDYHILFILDEKTSRRCLRLLLRYGKVVSSAWVEAPIFNFRTRLSLYPYVRSRENWENEQEYLPFPWD
jgi:hypothetical protein